MNCLDLQFRGVSEGFLLRMWEREGQGGGAALPCLVQQSLKHKSYTFLQWRLLRSSGICLFNLQPYVNKLISLFSSIIKNNKTLTCFDWLLVALLLQNQSRGAFLFFSF